jgi:hypothetical protein
MACMILTIGSVTCLVEDLWEPPGCSQGIVRISEHAPPLMYHQRPYESDQTGERSLLIGHQLIAGYGVCIQAESALVLFWADQ